MALVGKPHISFSELMDWTLCPHYHWLKHVLQVGSDPGSIHTAFGTAVHEAIEAILLEETLARHEGEDWEYTPIHDANFDRLFQQEVQKLIQDEIEVDQELVMEMRKQGENLLPEVVPALREAFPGFELVATEMQLYELMPGTQKKFKGFVDLVIKHEGRFVILDWKTCRNGWPPRQKSSTRKVYQLALYQHFSCQKEGWSPEETRAFFALLKREGKPGRRVEIFEVSVKKKRKENALKLLRKAVYNIERSFHIKDWRGCKHKDRFGVCPFMETEHCRRR